MIKLFPNCACFQILRFVPLLLLVTAAALQSAPQSTRPDLLLFNANIVTMNSRQPTAQAIAIQRGRIVWLGGNEESRKLFSRTIPRMDLGGSTVLPGIIDAHTHLLELGKSLLRLNLKDVTTQQQAVDRVRKRVA